MLALVSACEGAWTPAQVRDALDATLAYTTVMTVLARLHAKGLVTRQGVGRGYAYRAVPDHAVTARRMQHLLAAGGDRAGVLARFVDTLSPDDERVLRGLLAAEEGPR